MAESNPNEVLLRVAQALEEQNTRAKTKQKEKDKFKPGKLVGALAKNSAAVLGLSQGLTSIKGFFAQAVKDNQQVTKQLSLFTAASTQTSREMVGSLNTGFNTMQESLATQGELIDAGLGDFSKSNKEAFLGMKALGINLKSAISITRFNNEALGISAERSSDLSKSVVQAAIANGTSISELVGAIESMKVALTKTAVELGPEMSLKVQNVVARMTQNNSELAGAASQFVTSFLAGEDGFMKAARLGVGFTGRETEAELVSKIEQLSSRIAQMSAGAQGFGGGVVFQRLEDAFGITRENVIIARDMGMNIKKLAQGSIKSAAEQLAEMDATRQIRVQMWGLQSKGIDIAQGMASVIAPLGPWMPAALTLLGTIAAATQMMAFKGALGAKGEQLGMLGAMKAKRGAGAYGLMAAGAITTGKDIFDVATKDDATTGDKMGAVGGVLAGAVGFALLGGPIGAGIAASIGNQLGNYIGDQIGTESVMGKEQAKARERMEEILNINTENADNTAEIKRIQQDQERRARSLANPQISILTSINDVLVQNMLALQRANRQREEGNEIRKDMSFNSATSTVPALHSNIGNF
jgi:hypothetical protein